MTSSRHAAWLFAAVVAAGCAPLERGERPVETDAGGVDDALLADAGGSAPSFAADVLPLLLHRCVPCHREREPGAASNEYVLTEDAAADLARVIALVDIGAPDTSRLLQKARGESHGGGNVLPKGSAEYAIVTAWIAAGAPP